MCDTVQLLTNFIKDLSASVEYCPDDSRVSDICKHIHVASIPSQLKYETILNLCFLLKDERLLGSTLSECKDTINTSMEDELLKFLITRLIPMLPRITNDKVSSAGRKKIGNAARFRRLELGFTSAADEARQKWRSEGGLRSIPLFHVVLRFLKQHQLSPNLWWITPGILNLLDDISDNGSVRIEACSLLHQFLRVSMQTNDSSQFSFASSGLFELYHPILINMCSFMPPLTSSRNTERIWKAAYPTLMLLYKAQCGHNSMALRDEQGKMLAVTILQQSIPKVASIDVKLTSLALEFAMQLLDELGPFSVRYLQRIIYSLGEHIARAPFLTESLVLDEKALDLLARVVEICPHDCIKAHKYDFLAYILLTCQKYSPEDRSVETVLIPRIRSIATSLRKAGCDYKDDYNEISKEFTNFSFLRTILIDS